MILNPQFIKLVSRENSEEFYCPICLKELVSNRYCIRDNHKFSMKAYYMCTFDYYRNNKEYSIILRDDDPYTIFNINDCCTQKCIFKMDFEYTIDDFNFKDINSVIQRIETYALFR